ncbi:MAG: HAMP domain-containing histidine kinase, partial [Magnetovibrio sp.]|nr:HAMP domain-containing histidine kinase [Magnetovibrio sp.]
MKAGNHLLELINEILDLSRIEAGRVKLDMEDVDPHEVLEDCVAYISPLAKRRGVSLSASIPPLGLMSIHTDRMRFRQVLLNLLSNAVKYNVDDGSVVVSVHEDVPGYVRFCVTDTGPGIAADKQEEIFEPFSRLGAESTDIEGTSIGLTISRKLTLLMAGHLGFESQLGHGSKFWIDLPCAALKAPPVQESRTDTHLPQLPDGLHTVLY